MSKFALLFLLVFFGGIFATFYYHGVASFIVYQIVYFLNPENRWWSNAIPSLRYSFMAVLLMLLMLGLNYKSYTKISPWIDMPPLKWMIALMLMYYAAFGFALSPEMHDIYTFQFTKLIVIIFIAYKLIDSEKALDACLWAYLVGASYIGYYAAWQGRNAFGRVEGIGMVDSPGANDTAAALVPSAVLLMYFAWQGSLKVRVISVILGGLIANGLVLINSRGSFLGVVVSLGVFLFYMIFSKYQKDGQKAMAIFMIVAGLAGAYSMTDDLFWERMGTLKQVDEDKNASGSSRMVFWWTTFDMLEDYPLGLGIYGYNVLAPDYMDDETRGGVRNRSVHSTWFQGLAELGFIGLAIFLAMLMSLANISRAAKKYVVSKQQYSNYFKLLALEAALLGYLVAATFIDRFRSEILYWMILFLAIGVKLYYLNPSNTEKSASSGKKSR